MTGQTRTHSALESVTNTLVGLAIAIATQRVVFPWFDIQVDHLENVAIAAIFTAVSIVRSYAVRRTFNAFHAREQA